MQLRYYGHSHQMQRRDTSTNWNNNDPILHEGEIGIELDNRQMKIGDGKTSWSDLEYIYDNIPLATSTNKGLVSAVDKSIINSVPRIDIRLQRLEMLHKSGIRYNGYLVTFDDLNGIKVTKGIWNTTDERMECTAFVDEHNTPYLLPGAIEYKSTATYGVEYRISWDSPIIPEGLETTGYEFIVERSIDNEPYQFVVKTTDTHFGEIPDLQWRMIKYRVYVISNGASSPYVYTDFIEITGVLSPVITTSDPTNMGLISGDVSINIEETDPYEIIWLYDNKIISNKSNIFTADYQTMKNGYHSAQVILYDTINKSYSTKSFRWFKDVGEIMFELETVMDADERPESVAMVQMGNYPSGASAKFEVCNNAMDKDPVWEDMSLAVDRDAVYNFTNNELTSEFWAVSFRVTINRELSKEPVYIYGIGGSII